jgi:PAS domain S-box-containing protein
MKSLNGGLSIWKKTKSEHRKLEEQLEDEIAWRRMLVEQSRDGIVVLDRDCKVFEANRRYAEMLGYTMDEVRNLYVWDWDFLFPKEKLIEMIRSVDAEGDHFETRHHRKDGTVIDVEISTNGAVYKGQKLVFLRLQGHHRAQTIRGGARKAYP